MELFLIDLAQSHPTVLAVLSGLYVLSAINKPLFTLLHKYVEATESDADNELLKKVEGSRAYKVISYVLDWAVRIKLPAPKERPK